MSETPPKTDLEKEIENQKTEAAEKPKVASIVTTTERSKVHPLKFEVEFDGTVYKEVPIKRCTAKEISEYNDVLRAYINSEANGMSPVPPWIDIPQEVYDAMDDDDNYHLEEAAVDFIPRRLMKFLQTAIDSESISETAEVT